MHSMDRLCIQCISLTNPHRSCQPQLWTQFMIRSASVSSEGKLRSLLVSNTLSPKRILWILIAGYGLASSWLLLVALPFSILDYWDLYIYTGAQHKARLLVGFGVPETWVTRTFMVPVLEGPILYGLRIWTGAGESASGVFWAFHAMVVNSHSVVKGLCSLCFIMVGSWQE